LNFWSEGRCQITTIDEDGEHINALMRGYETCLFKDMKEEIVDARDFIGKLPDDPEKMEEVIRKVEQKEK